MSNNMIITFKLIILDAFFFVLHFAYSNKCFVCLLTRGFANFTSSSHIKIKMRVCKTVHACSHESSLQLVATADETQSCIQLDRLKLQQKTDPTNPPKDFPHVWHKAKIRLRSVQACQNLMTILITSGIQQQLRSLSFKQGAVSWLLIRPED